MRLTILEQLTEQVELEGLEPGSERYEWVLRERKIQLCQEKRGTPSCAVCPYFDHCELSKAHLRDLRYNKPK